MKLRVVTMFYKEILYSRFNRLTFVRSLFDLLTYLFKKNAKISILGGERSSQTNQKDLLFYEQYSSETTTKIFRYFILLFFYAPILSEIFHRNL